MNLHLSTDQSASLSRALADVSRRLAQQPELIQKRANYMQLVADISPTYGAPRMMSDASKVRIAFRENGWIYDLDEANERGSSGGWMGSCIPEGRVTAFARAWLEQTDPHRGVQLAFF